MNYDDYNISSGIPCGFNGCKSYNFAVDWETSSHIQCVDLICYRCEHRTQVSHKNHRLMVDLENHMLYEAIEHRMRWTTKASRKAMMRHRIKEDMK